MKTYTFEEFTADCDSVCEQAIKDPVRINVPGHGSVVLMGIDEYQRLKRRDRVAMRAEDLPQDVIDEIAATDMDPAYDHLNYLLDDDKDDK